MCMCVCLCMANRCTHMFYSLGSDGVKDKQENKTKSSLVDVENQITTFNNEVSNIDHTNFVEKPESPKP